ncbi:hypothetical protein BBJ28_00010360 [Nothophytophthora sp. Chile5]|nr:hypothetical protein BBJ28_00010360 [Nothophytophthora sp. Chile5]
MGNGDYGAVFGVFLAVAIVLVGSTTAIAKYCFPPKDKKSSIKELVQKSIQPTTKLGRGVKLFYYGLSMMFVQDDGSATGFIDYFCDKNELAGLADWRKKTAVVRPRWMRFFAIVTSLLVTLSLAFLLGTVVYNNESCSSTQTVNYCSQCSCSTLCDGVKLGCTSGCQCYSSSECSSYSCSGASSTVSSTSATSVTSTVCEKADISYSVKANAVTVFLTQVMAFAFNMAVTSAINGSPYQKRLSLATTVAAIGLVVFGVLYSNQVAKEHDTDSDANSRRMAAILTTLFTGWWIDQVVGIGTIHMTFVGYRICYDFFYKPKLGLVKLGAGTAAVYPTDGHALDDSIRKTDGAAGKQGTTSGEASETVTLESVTLQPPSEPHQ